jgi:hypothetical protein
LERLKVTILHGKANNRLTESPRSLFTETMTAFGSTALHKNQELRVQYANRTLECHVDYLDQLAGEGA